MLGHQLDGQLDTVGGIDGDDLGSGDVSRGDVTASGGHGLDQIQVGHDAPHELLLSIAATSETLDNHAVNALRGHLSRDLLKRGLWRRVDDATMHHFADDGERCCRLSHCLLPSCDRCEQHNRPPPPPLGHPHELLPNVRNAPQIRRFPTFTYEREHEPTRSVSYPASVAFPSVVRRYTDVGPGPCDQHSMRTGYGAGRKRCPRCPPRPRLKSTPAGSRAATLPCCGRLPRRRCIKDTRRSPCTRPTPRGG